MAKFVKAGTPVCIVSVYKNKADLNKCGVMLEDGRIGEGAGWDIYDIRLDSKRETFAPGFNIRKRGAGRPIARRAAARRR